MSTTMKRGVWALASDPDRAAALTRLGFDWVALDAQHGQFDDRAMQRVFTARRDDSVPVHVRVRSRDAGLIGRTLDVGAAGVIVPMVNSAGQARDVVAAAMYPPLGIRSWGPFLGASDRATRAPHEANAEVRIAVMIETAEAVENVDEIAGVQGVDTLFVGPFDLAIALGVPLDDLLADTSPTSPLARILSAAERHGIVAGAFAGTPERARTLGALGFTFVAIATDALLLEAGARAVLG
jgi:4-hydroxy-2-oxoheptanedioate aldolase